MVVNAWNCSKMLTNNFTYFSTLFKNMRCVKSIYSRILTLCYGGVVKKKPRVEFVCVPCRVVDVDGVGCGTVKSPV